MEYKINEEENSFGVFYGVDVLIDSGATVSFPSISDSKAEITKLILLFTQFDVELCHIEYIIEDFLTDFKI